MFASAGRQSSKGTLWGFPPVVFSVSAINVQHPRRSVLCHIVIDFLVILEERKEVSLGRDETKIDKSHESGKHRKKKEREETIISHFVP